MEKKYITQVLNSLDYKIREAYKKGYEKGAKETLEKDNSYWEGYNKAMKDLMLDISRMDVKDIATTKENFDINDY